MKDTKKEKRLSSDDRNRAEPCCKHSPRKTTRPIPLIKLQKRLPQPNLQEALKFCSKHMTVESTKEEHFLAKNSL